MRAIARTSNGRAGPGLIAEADPAQRGPLVDAPCQAIAGYWSTLGRR